MDETNTTHEVHEEHVKHDYHTKGKTMEPVLSSSIVPTLGGYGYGGLYGGRDGLGELYLANQNTANLEAINRNALYLGDKVDTQSLQNSMDSARGVDATQNAALLSTIQNDTQSANLVSAIGDVTNNVNSRFNAIENRLELSREIDCQTNLLSAKMDCQTQAIIASQEKIAAETERDQYRFPKPAITPGCPVAAGGCPGNGVDVNQIAIAIGGVIDQKLGQLATVLNSK